MRYTPKRVEILWFSLVRLFHAHYVWISQPHKLQSTYHLLHCKKRGKFLKILKLELLSNCWSDLYQIYKLKLRGPNQNWILFEMNTTYNERQPQNIKSGISEQPLIRSYCNLKLMLKMRKTSNEKAVGTKPKLNISWKLGHIAKGKCTGNPKGYLECGSAQLVESFEQYHRICSSAFNHYCSSLMKCIKI